jgi:PAS domain S-box-containing protein/putative nucleotidyltransferase with HDIG domain
MGIILIDTDHTIVMINAARDTKFRRPLSNPIGKKCFREFEKRDAVCPYCPGVRAMATGQLAEAETEAVRDDGSRYNVRLQAFPFIGDDDTVAGFIEIAEDITERKRAEAALCESAEKYRIITSTAMDGFAELDLDGRILDVNEESCRMIGYSKDEQLTMSIKDIEVIETPVMIKSRIQKIIETGSDRFESRLRRKDGRIIDIEASSTFFPDNNHLLVFHRDITERKRAETALRESEERFRKVVETMKVGLAAVDEHGILTYINEYASSMIGYSVDEMIGHDPTDFYYDEEERKTQKEIFEKRRKGMRDAPTHEVAWRTKDGRKVYSILSPTPIFDSEGRYKGSFAIDTEITERKQAEEALQHSYHQLRETFIETVNALASTVEMKDPYTAGHQRWATRLACAIAKEMDLSEGRIEGIRMAGLIHDIGKINIPAEILSKPGHLSEIQYNMVKIHPQVGCDILREIKFPWPVAQIVLQHHERMDGSGYPQGLSGQQILLEARILAVADAVEAMSSHRPYRPAHGVEKALEEISQYRGTLYDPQVVDACLRVFEKGFRFD